VMEYIRIRFWFVLVLSQPHHLKIVHQESGQGADAFPLGVAPPVPGVGPVVEGAVVDIGTPR
jgi:hypothetical protein